MQQVTRVLGGRYEVGPVLGQGGMAVVHQGWDRELRRPVAIKVLSAPFDRDRDFVERFRREARSAAGLGHPNIVAVFDTGSDDGTHYIVTELVEGETLADRLRRDGPMPPAEVISIGADVTRALAAAHERGVIHRDVKPGNVMLSPEGRVKVVDFGIARAVGSETLTGTGKVMGTTAYLSPEQARGDPVDERSDLYALGCVLYEMITGSVPFRADTPVATMYRHVNEEPEPPSSLVPVPAGLERVAMRCLEKDPRRRFRSAAELEQELLSSASDTEPLVAVGADRTRPLPAAVAGTTDALPAAAPSGPSARPWLLAAAGVALLGVLAAFAIGAMSDPTRQREQARGEPGGGAAEQSPQASSGSFADAWTNLMGAIWSGVSTGDIEASAAEELANVADEMRKAYFEGDLDKVTEEFEKFQDEFDKSVEEGEISPSAQDEIDQAMFELLTALESEGAFVGVSPPVEEDSSGEGNGESGNSGEGGGPPPHSEGDEGEG